MSSKLKERRPDDVRQVRWPAVQLQVATIDEANGSGSKRRRRRRRSTLGAAKPRTQLRGGEEFQLFASNLPKSSGFGRALRASRSVADANAAATTTTTTTTAAPEIERPSGKSKQQISAIVDRQSETSTNHRARISDDSPLIHTDQFNTTSGPLYVRAPLTRLVQFRQQRARQNKRLDSTNMAGESDLLVGAAEQAPPRLPESPNNVAILAAESDEPAQNQQQQQQASAIKVLVPRFEVLNLEIGSSVATLTWKLSLQATSNSEEELQEELFTSLADRRQRGPRKRWDANAAIERRFVKKRGAIGAEEGLFDDDEVDDTKLATESTNDERLLRRLDSPVGGGGQSQTRVLIQPLASSAQARRPPARAQVPSTAQVGDDQAENEQFGLQTTRRARSRGTMTTQTPQTLPIISSTSRARQQTSTIGPSGPPTSRRAPMRSRLNFAGPPASERGFVNAGLSSAISEPPMIKISSVPLNRINAPTVLQSRPTKPTSAPGQKDAQGTSASISAIDSTRSAKMLQLADEEKTSMSLSSSTTTTTTTSTTAQPLTATPATKHVPDFSLLGTDSTSSLQPTARAAMPTERAASRSPETLTTVRESQMPSDDKQTVQTTTQMPKMTLPIASSTTSDPSLAKNMDQSDTNRTTISATSTTITTTTTTTTTTTASPTERSIGATESKTSSREANASTRVNKFATDDDDQDAQPTTTKSPVLLKSALANSSTITSTTTSVPTSGRVTPRQKLTTLGYEKRSTKAPRGESSAVPASASSKLSTTSKWFVRLRRFGSNEVDIVKVVINDLPTNNANTANASGQSAMIPTNAALERSITFKNLEPSSAYEICVESASPMQQIGDQLHILNANHFLKCQDTSEANLSESLARRGGDNQGAVANSTLLQIRRLDLIGTNDEKPQAARAGPSAMAERPANKPKLKSLCREFFTLPVASSTGSQRQGASNGTLDQAERVISFGNTTESSVLATTLDDIAARRPKALAKDETDNNDEALRSHTELMEISFASAVQNESGSHDAQDAPTASVGNKSRVAPFEMVAASWSPGSLSTAGRTGRASLFSSPTGSNPTLITDNLLATSTNGTTRLAQLSNNIEYLPIIGCLFVLVFLASIANMLLNALSCGSDKRHSAAAAAAAARARQQARRLKHRRGSPLSPSPGSGTSAALVPPGGSYYSATGSEQSSGSQARIVVVGHKAAGDASFANASAYFELPPSVVELGSAGSRTSAAESQILNNAKQSVYLLSNSARFPLGPSFEGDERHNADMVGLARRNYDAFINNIYNADSLTNELTNAELNSSRSGPQSTEIDERREQENQGPATSFLAKSTTSYQRKVDEQFDKLSSSASSNSTQMAAGGYTRHKRAPSTSSSSAATRQRLRFDKVNPIYNMHSIQATTVHTPPNVSSFGPASLGNYRSSGAMQQKRQSAGNLQHHRAAQSRQQRQSMPMHPVQLTEVEAANRGSPDCCQQQCTCGESLQRDCETIECTCNGEQQTHCIESGRNFDCNAGENCSVGGGCGGEDDGDRGAHSAGAFSCCLDKQKQRLQAQQQQLNRAQTLSGSRLPQPYISADSPLPAGARNAGVDLSLASSEMSEDLTKATSDQHQASKPATAEQSFQFGEDDDDDDHNEFISGAAEHLMGNTQRSQQISVHPSGHAHMTTNPIKMSPAQSSPPPPPPPPPPPLSTLPRNSVSSPEPPNTNTTSSTNKVLVSVTPSSSQARKQSDSETIDKTDFAQRRSELESKLHLAGMSRADSRPGTT